MNQKNIHQIIYRSLNSLIWLFIGINIFNVLYTIVNFVLMQLWINRQENIWINISPISTMTSIALFLIIIFVWILIYHFMNQKYTKSFYLKTLFKLLLGIVLFQAFQSLLGFIGVYQHYPKEMINLEFFIQRSLTFLFPIVIITFLLIIIKSYSQKIDKSKLIVFRNLSFMIFIFDIGYKIYGLMNTSYKEMFSNPYKYALYLNLSTIFSVISSIFSIIVWGLFINSFVKNYDNNENVEETIEDDNYYLDNYNQTVINSLKEFHLVIIGAIGHFLQIGALLSFIIKDVLKTQNSFINNFKSQLLMEYLNLPFIPIIIFTLIIYISLIVIVYKKKQSILPILSLFIIYIYQFIFIVLTILYAILMVISTNYEIKFEFSNLGVSILVITTQLSFISVLLMNYFKPLKKEVVTTASYGFIVMVILNIIINALSTKEILRDINYLGMNVLDSLNFARGMIIILVSNLLILIFWIGLAAIYPTKYSEFYDELNMK